MSGRPITSDIGATENALRSLLERTLVGTGVGGYDEWVYLNVRDAYADDQVESRVAEILKAATADVHRIRAALADAGTLTADGALTAEGGTRLAEARARVADAVAPLTAGLDPADLATAVSVLDAIRIRAEAALDA